MGKSGMLSKKHDASTYQSNFIAILADTATCTVSYMCMPTQSAVYLVFHVCKYPSQPSLLPILAASSLLYLHLYLVTYSSLLSLPRVLYIHHPSDHLVYRTYWEKVVSTYNNKYLEQWFRFVSWEGKQVLACMEKIQHYSIVTHTLSMDNYWMKATILLQITAGLV